MVCLLMGIGKVRWLLRTDSGKMEYLHARALYVPDCRVKLVSPQSIFQEHGSGSFVVDCTTGAKFSFPNSNETLSFSLGQGQFPTAQLARENEFEDINGAFPASVVLPDNVNLTRAQKELLQHHQQIGHFHVGWIQERLMRPHGSDEELVLQAKNKGKTSCNLPSCSSCQFCKQTKRPTEAAAIRTDQKWKVHSRGTT